MFDMLIAIPAPTTPTSNLTMVGTYWISSLEFPGGGLANVRNTNFSLASTTGGSFVGNTVTGQAANLGNILMNQTVNAITYSISADGSGTITFPLSAGLNGNQQLISGVENVFMSADGSDFGGSTAVGGHGLIVGVRNLGTTATNASWNGFFYTAGMRFDTSPARLTSVVGAAYADGKGNSTWARRTSSPTGCWMRHL